MPGIYLFECPECGNEITGPNTILHNHLCFSCGERRVFYRQKFFDRLKGASDPQDEALKIHDERKGEL